MTNVSPTPPGSDPPPVDKTIVEGPDAVPRRTALAPGARAVLGATQAASAGPARAPSAIALPSGEEPIPLGSGVIAGVLGSGGMARVYKIWNDKLEVHRAVKIILPTENKELLGRFETEVKISAKLRHPNIVEIFTVGEWQGLPYLEMEIIEGESLESIINHQGRLPDVLACAVAIFVARALNYAHTQKLLIYGKTYHGLIHRDLKPANIMISRSGEVKLMDFGIARPTETSLHTVEGNIVGTLPYLAPEQIDGLDMDNRVDIYACGTILYEMLTGTKTFPQNTITNLMKNKVTNTYRRFEDFGFGVSPLLAKIAQKCLQVSKESRYATSGELLSALEAAHKKIADETPERIVQAFQSSPGSIRASASARKAPAFLKPIVLIPAGGVVALSALIVILLLTGPKSKTAVAAKPAVAAPASVQPSAPTPSTPAAEQGLRPLGETPRAVVPPPVVSAPPPRPAPRPVPPPSAGERKPPAREAAKPAVKPAGSPLDQLKQAYGSDDAFAAGQTAFQKRRFADAIDLLQSLPPGHPQTVKRDVMLMESMVESGRLGDAIDMSGSLSIKDAQFELSTGKAYFKTRNYGEALRHFETSMQCRSLLRDRGEVLKDALYYTALVRSAQYRQNPGGDAKQTAYDAWYKLKLAVKDPNDPRFKKAVEDLASIQ